ncbi:hypothetical protein RB598_004991 [Gaeumannomyces tritici]
MVRISGQSRAVLLTASLAKLATAAQAACVFFWQANPGDTCQSIARDWSLTAHQFVALNPSVGPACANGVTSGVEYCVMGDPETGGPATTTTKATTRPPTSTSAPPTTLLTSTSTTAPPTTTQDPNIPSPTQPGTIEGCRSYYEVVEGDDCETVQRKHNNRFSMEEFYFWNPEVGGAACGNLWTEYYVCVDADARLPTPTGPSLPGPTQPGVVGFCTEFHKAQEGEVCSTVAERYGNRFPLKQFYQWNPEAGGAECRNLWTNYYDDLLILLSWVFHVAFATAGLAAVPYGFGKHMSDLPAAHQQSVLRLIMVASATWSVGVAFAKASFACLYLRLTSNRSVGHLNRAVIAFQAVQASVQVAYKGFQCIPMQKAWDASVPGSCVSLVPMWWMTFICNISVDLILFIQPIPYIWQLQQMSAAKKAGVILMLSLGLFICMISVVRILQSVRTDNTDMSYQLVDPII